jgi:hypothetical protein
MSSSSWAVTDLRKYGVLEKSAFADSKIVLRGN